MTQEMFWEIIDKSWFNSSKLYEQRKKAVESNNEELLEQLSYKLEDVITKNYVTELSKLSKEKLTNFIHILEEKIYTIDRKEIQAHTDGSDDGFLYCRCFIVGMGEEYYNRINKTPSKATFDLEAEGFGFSAYLVYEDLFDEEFNRYSKHSMESCSNENGWK